ncbi:chromosome segregation protein SMC [Pseudoramibacter alactolyticus]|jgi:chromosome segregation protein|uniref:chromosome segregation protein SMC n=1 Tax=Pseudoramibacter alactolyticus TaxID=113287 RepID=UPI0023530B7B|nr:chromosome segregation protein SMC [Pseudoramibacter alactolyticus]MBM6968321.1 chromosome segregation protein SMC [Pseudoramibacter alactolyticus]
MHLKSLRITGFKSFADTVELSFDQMIAAIVGPNGSGKSNIIDAIRWVLGEQRSKSLRGKRMEDVIFSGSDYHKPMNYAEVVLTLDNGSGYLADQPDEVSVTRRIFRSGESVYKINGRQVRLKDIQTIFADTGLGRNGYSIVGQGSIENIVNSSPQALREIVEEAVGIVNYKMRKQEAERELTTAQENMDRVLDILEELNRQRKPLEKQSAKAKRYLKLREELKAVDLFRFDERWRDLSDRLAQSDAHIADANAQIKQTEIALHDADARYQRLRVQNRNQLAAQEDLEAQAESIRQALTAVKESKVVLAEKIRHGQNDMDKLREREKLQNEQWQSAQNALAIAQEAVAAEQQKLKDLIQKMGRYQAKDRALALSLRTIQEKMDRRMQAEQALSDRRSALAKQQSQLMAEQASLETRMTIAQQNLQTIRADIQDRKQQIEAMQMALEARQVRTEQLNAENQTLQKQWEAENQTYEDLLNRYRLQKNNSQVANSKWTYLKNAQDRYQNYYPGIRLIMKPDVLPDVVRKAVYGPVGELMDVPETLTQAIDTVLGGRSQNIVVAKVETANACIELLKKHRAGRETFLPLDNLHFRSLDSRGRAEILKQSGVYGVASELVSCDAAVRPAIDSLLGRVVVVRHFDAAKPIRKRFRQLTIVTLSGEVFYPGGAIVGGTSKKQKNSPIAHKAELARLQAELKTLKAEGAVLKRRLAEQKIKIDDLKGKRAALKEDQTHWEQENWQQEQRQKALEQHLKNLQDNLETAENTDRDLQVQNENRKQTQKTLEQRMASLADRENGEEALTARKADLERQRFKLREALSTLEIQKARSEEICRQSNRLLTERKTQIESLAGEQKRMQIEREKGSAALAAAQKDLAQAQAQIAEIEEKHQRITAKRQTQNENQKIITLEIETMDGQIRSFNHDLVAQNEAKNKLEIAQNRILAVKEGLEEKIRTRYDFNPLMVSDWLADHDLSEADVSEKRQQELSQQIEALGNVNVGAIESFSALNTRYQFVRGQYRDLESSKQEVETIIQALSEAMTAQFAEGFEKLQKSFGEIFKILFEGGQASLRYEDPDHILESGIELMARPPGKHLKQLSLLSGGEKSMTAIALLFAFLTLNPSPFCVIDEIDAALDDHNIDRFTRYLETVADKTQFILITHRKNTLKVCDTIYGVSMAKSGVSKLLSIHISDYTEPKRHS